MKKYLIAALSTLVFTSGTAWAEDNQGVPLETGLNGGRALGMLLYRAAGARQILGSRATSVTCSNFTGSTHTAQIILRNWNFSGPNAYNVTFSIPANSNRTYSTQNTLWLSENLIGDGANSLTQGTLMIRGTSRDLHCSAWISDATLTSPAGATPLHLVRFNAATGSTE